MGGFLEWFFAFITTMFSGIGKSIGGFFKGLFLIFDFKTYFGLFSNYQEDFGLIGWVFALLAFLLVYAFWIGLIFLIVLGVRKYIRFRRSLVANEDLLEEIADLHRDVIRLTKDREKLITMKLSPGYQGYNELRAALREDGGEAYGMMSDEVKKSQQDMMMTSTVIGGDSSINVTAKVKTDKDEISPDMKRFFRLDAVDEKYESFVFEPYNNDFTLKDLCEELRNYACSQARLYYEIKTIRLMIAGLSSTKMILLQGISGTGKTSLPYVMGKYFQNDASIASVQPSWRDRAELFGFFNEFTKKFNETEVLRRIYESSYTDDINIIVLDEMNIARVEYYFAEMLSILEIPDPDEWRIQLVPSVWQTDPKQLADGKLKIPQNVWYVGTANNDDSTFAISDKVYDRAFVINLDKKGVAFESPKTPSRRVSYTYVESLYKKAVEEQPIRQELLDKVEKLDNYVIEHFRVAFGNRIMKQLKIFVPVYAACGGDDIEALDYLLATKVIRKFESLNLSLIREEIKGLINFMDNLFGKDAMAECIAALRRLQKAY